MATITLSLGTDLSKKDQNEVDHLLAAALCRENDEVAERLERPAIKRLIKSGALKINPFAHHGGHLR